MDKMKILCIVLLNYVFVHQVNGAGVTSVTDSFECAQYVCDQNQGHNCSDGSSFFEDEEKILLCTPNTGYCSLKRLRNLNGTFAFHGECLDECGDEFTDYTVPDALHRCCSTHQCNLDVTKFPTDCIDDALPTIFKGTFQAATQNFDAIAIASCEHGYKVTGGSQITCLANGTWTLSTASCQRLTCDLNLLPVLANGTFTATNHNSGDQATATCNNGFELTGSDTIDCQENETWSQSTAGCQQIKCNLADLPAVQNGSYDAVSNNMGDEAKLTCDTGHYANATSTLVCQQNKTWTEPNNAAFCLQATDCTHNPLPTVSDGVFLAISKNFGDTAKLTCAVGHTLNGTETIMCRNDGTWESPSGTCEEDDNSSVDAPSNLSAGGLAGIACGSTAGLASLGSLAFLGLRRFKARQNEVQPIG